MRQSDRCRIRELERENKAIDTAADFFAAGASKLEEALRREKELRISYQSIVYDICNILDARAGRHATKGTCITIDKVVEDLRDQLAAGAPS